MWESPHAFEGSNDGIKKIGTVCSDELHIDTHCAYWYLVAASGFEPPTPRV